MTAVAFRVRAALPARNLCRCLSTKAVNEQTNPVRGMKDRFGEENRRFKWIVDRGAHLSNLYGFEQITTPILEYSRVFERTLGDDSDVVGKELYSFEDKGGSRLTMRPEGTAGITRALISQKQYTELPQKYYYHGPMFRHERPQKGRLRQFEQFGVEVYGQSHASSDVETIELASKFLKSLGLESLSLEVNSLGDNQSRQRYRAALKDYLSEYKDRLSADSVNRLETNPLRILDSKSPQDIEILKAAPSLSDYLSETSRDRFSFITETLQHLEIPFIVNSKLVRGLDYYQDTVFEFKVSSPLLGAQQGTVLAGGRYDGLVEKMGGPTGVPSIGWAAGLERLSLLVKDQDIPKKRRPIAIIPVPDRAVADSISAPSATSAAGLHSHAFNVSATIREQGFPVEFMHLTSSTSTKSQLPKQLAKASKLNASHAVLIGTEEMSRGVVTFRDLDKMEQKHCKVEDLASELGRVDIDNIPK
ncbi:histidyl-tRNA synthetase [Entomortierella parvispora]|uniref:histidine--tRNA ligase n=1 Tax=Entomortierella parvispora TaxID=205924 RepID=A0A9P3HLD7_9FUNG|nr:histidyl-tRNA synthetase [Entomortierella parvispora]